MLVCFLLALLCSVCFSFIVHIVSYVDNFDIHTLMESILHLATCHCTFCCVILLFYYLGKYILSLAVVGGLSRLASTVKKPSVLTSAAVHQAAVSPDNKAGQTEGRKEPRCREK